MRERVLKVLRPLIVVFFYWALSSLKNAFISEDKTLCSVLRKKGFHPALCSHPSILFGAERDKIIHKPLIFEWLLVSFINISIRIGVLKDDKCRVLMRKLGIQPYFEYGMDSWLTNEYMPMVSYTIPDNPKPKGKIAVYSALTGEYDSVNEVLYKEDDVDYFLFTNNPSLDSRTWTIVPVKSELDDLLLSREVKMLPHKYLSEEYEISIYIDANAVIYGELSQLSRHLVKEKVFAVTRHSVRKTVWEEIEECAKLGKVNREKAEAQYNRYLSDGFEDKETLFECGILVRKHNDKELQSLMHSWYKEFRDGVHRDQLSLPPCISRLGYKDYVVMDGSVWHNQFNRLVNHKKK